MLDYLRTLDVVSRANRKLIKAINRAIEIHLVTHNTEPSNEELAEILGEEVEKINDARIASDIYTVMPLDDQLQVGDGGAALEKVERDELVDVIKSILSDYSEREQLIIQLYYFEELTLKEISGILNITESRISQIHKSVIRKIKMQMGEDHG